MGILVANRTDGAPSDEHHHNRHHKTSFESSGSPPSIITTPELNHHMDDHFRISEPTFADPDGMHVDSSATTSSLKPSIATASESPPLTPNTGRPHQTSPRHSVDVARRTSNGQRKRDITSHKSGGWRKLEKKYHSIVGGSSNESSAYSADHSSAATHSSDHSHDQLSAGMTHVQSSTTGCSISAPMSPPVGYPMPGAPVAVANTQPLPPAAIPGGQQLSSSEHRASVISSTSSSGESSGGRPGSTKSIGPPAPRWAQPPGKTPPQSSIRSTSFDSGLDRPEVKINPEHILGPAGEWVEVLKGEQGRIAIKSTPAQYEVMVWLPGFRLDDITIVSRRHQVLHIVADQWEENDHAQWEIKLGPDAMMTSVRAAFTGQELKITVQRAPRVPSANQSVRSNASMRTASSRAAPSLAATVATAGHNVGHQHPHHERSFSNPTAAWGEQERHELEARMTRGTAAMGLI